MHPPRSATNDHFPIKQGLARRLRRTVLLPVCVVALFTLLVIFQYDFSGSASNPMIMRVIFYGVTVRTFAILGGLVWLQWRRAPRDLPTAGLTVSNESIAVDFGWGLRSVPLHSVGRIVPVRRRDNETPIALLLASPSVNELSQRDTNRVLHKIGDRWARLHRFRQSTILPIYLFGEDQADRIITAIERRMSTVPREV